MNNITENEINLRELFRIILDKKIFIFIFTSLITLVAIVFIYNKTPLFQVEAVLKIGSIGFISEDKIMNEQIEDSNDLIKRINVYHNISIPKKELTRVSNISLLKNTKNLINIKVVSTSNNKAKNKLNTIINAIKNDHKVISNNSLKLLNKKLKFLIAEEKRIFMEIEFLNKIINRTEKLSNKTLITNPTLSLVYSLNLNTKTNELIFLKNRVYNLGISDDINRIKNLISSKDIYDTKIINNIIVSDTPIQPKSFLIIVSSFITGLILSILLIFVLRFIRELKD